MGELELISGRIYSYIEVRKLLNISKATGAKFIKTGRLNPSLVATKYRFTGEELINFLNTSRVNGENIK